MRNSAMVPEKPACVGKRDLPSHDGPPIGSISRGRTSGPLVIDAAGNPSMYRRRLPPVPVSARCFHTLGGKNVEVPKVFSLAAAPPHDAAWTPSLTGEPPGRNPWML